MILKDMLLSMDRIEEYLSNLDFRKFKMNYLDVDAIIRNFEIIGEASKKLDDKIKEKYPDVPWKEMYYLRNRVSHEYFGVDYEIIWDVATNYLPDNKNQIDQIIEKEK